MSEGKSTMIEIGALWSQTSKAGVKYLSGKLGSAKLLIFRNERKEAGSNAPDYRAFVCEAPAKQQGAKGSKQGNGQGSQQPTGADDDLPF